MITALEIPLHLLIGERLKIQLVKLVLPALPRLPNIHSYDAGLLWNFVIRPEELGPASNKHALKLRSHMHELTDPPAVVINCLGVLVQRIEQEDCLAFVGDVINTLVWVFLPEWHYRDTTFHTEGTQFAPSIVVQDERCLAHPRIGKEKEVPILRIA